MPEGRPEPVRIVRIDRPAHPVRHADLKHEACRDRLTVRCDWLGGAVPLALRLTPHDMGHYTAYEPVAAIVPPSTMDRQNGVVWRESLVKVA